MNTLQTVPQTSLIPHDMGEAMDMARVMSTAGFLAKELQTVGGALFVIEQAMRWHMSPFAVAMETSFISGKPMFSGKIVAAALTSSGAVSGRLVYEYDGAGDDRRITVQGILRGETEPRSVTVVLRDARTNNRVWASQPDQQLAYHGARVWARRHAPEVMLGVTSPEEFEEPPAPPRTVVNLARPAPEPQPHVVPPDPEFPWITMDGKSIALRRVLWLKALGKALESLHDLQTLAEWHKARIATFESLPAEMAYEANEIMQARLAQLDGEGAAGEGGDHG